MAIMNKTITTFYKRCLCGNIFSLGKYPGKDCWVIGKCVLNLIVIVVQLVSCVLLSATTWTVSMGFPRQESWTGLSFHPPVDLPGSGIEPVFPALAGGFFTTLPPENSMCLSLQEAADQAFKDVSNLTPTRGMHTLAASQLPSFGNVRFLYCFGFFGGGPFQCVK